MRTIHAIALLTAMAVCHLGCSPGPEGAAKGQSPEAKSSTATGAKPASGPTSRQRGYANAESRRPDHFPHRIWAASDYEAKLPDYGLFGDVQTENIPKYPGNVSALRGRASQGYVGMNPVPGPFMGKVNYMCCRYLIKGAAQARFQHFSLTKGDNWNILVKGLAEGQWSDLTLNFTRDAKRNDARQTAPFTEVDRMDDLKVFFDYDKTGKIEMWLDDVIFFAEDPSLPPEKEPFPNRVLYTAGFDTGNQPEATAQKYFPGTYEMSVKPPEGAYWAALKAVAPEGDNVSKVVLKMPPKPAGAKTKMRFRYWIKGAEGIKVDGLKVLLHNATAEADHVVALKDFKAGQWQTQYVDFAESVVGGAKKPVALGDKLDAMTWIADGGADKVTLYIDEVILFEPGEPAK